MLAFWIYQREVLLLSENVEVFGFMRKEKELYVEVAKIYGKDKSLVMKLGRKRDQCPCCCCTLNGKSDQRDAREMLH